MATIFTTMPEDPTQRDEPAVEYYFEAPRHVVQWVEAAVQQAVDQCFEEAPGEADNAAVEIPEPAAQYVTTAEYVYSDFATNNMEDFVGTLQQIVPGAIDPAEDIEIVDEGELVSEAEILQIADDAAENVENFDLPPDTFEILSGEIFMETAAESDPDVES